MVKRYYAQYVDNCWKVFDRDFTSREGDCIPFCTCCSRARAFQVRDLLNKGEEEQVLISNFNSADRAEIRELP